MKSAQTTLASHTSPVETNYDEVPYENHPFRRTHPDALAVVGKLFGMNPTPPDQARILELGCGDGNNCVPLATIFPKSFVVGVDLSSVAIEKGKKTIADLGIKNAELHCVSIADITEKFGSFDYIVCHGIFSWVDDATREAILRVAKQNLAPNGIAYISYNCLPGWHYRGLARELMNFHAGKFKDYPLFIAQSRAILDFMATNANKDPIYHQTLKREVDTIRQIPDWHLFHDYLEVNNKPFYFHDFARMAGDQGLQYLGDTEVSKLVPQEFPAEVQQLLGKFSSDIVHFEQYMDFLRNRMFRRTVLCHDGIPLRREFRPDTVFEMLVAAPVRRDDSAPGVFLHPNGGAVRGVGIAMTSALDMLSRVWPHAVSVSKLFEAVRDAHPEVRELQEPQGPTLFSSGLLRFFLAEILEFRTTRYPLAQSIAEKPKAFELARVQAHDRGENASRVTSLLHEEVGLNPFLRSLVELANGTRTVEQITSELMARNPALPPDLPRQVEGGLQYLLRSAILTAL